MNHKMDATELSLIVKYKDTWYHNVEAVIKSYSGYNTHVRITRLKQPNSNGIIENPHIDDIQSVLIKLSGDVTVEIE